jgi:hypothetical protein
LIALPHQYSPTVAAPPPAGVGGARRSRWDAVAPQDPPDRRGADAVTESEQLALDPHVAPAPVVPGHPHHQGDEDVVDRRTTAPIRVGPSSADEAAMPAQDRVRSDQAMAPQCAGQPPREGGEHGPVRPVQARSGVGAAEHGDLVPQHEEFDVFSGGRAAHQQDQSEHLPDDQVQQPQRHIGIMPNQRSPQVSDPGPTSGTPHPRDGLSSHSGCVAVRFASRRSVSRAGVAG